jgi:hypothetical protein
MKAARRSVGTAVRSPTAGLAAGVGDGGAVMLGVWRRVRLGMGSELISAKLRSTPEAQGRGHASPVSLG